jgi:hypothetical protein
LDFMALQVICKSFNAEITEESQSSQSLILRRFAFLRTQSLTTLILCH